jgi:hypothetical protein
VRAIFSPTTEPIEPAMKKKSITASPVGTPPIVARPVRTASLSPVALRACA